MHQDLLAVVVTEKSRSQTAPPPKHTRSFLQHGSAHNKHQQPSQQADTDRTSSSTLSPTLIASSAVFLLSYPTHPAATIQICRQLADQPLYQTTAASSSISDNNTNLIHSGTRPNYSSLCFVRPPPILCFLFVSYCFVFLSLS